LLTGSAFRLTGMPYSELWGMVTVFGALGLILGSVLFALLAALIDLYDEE